jgi:DNA-binding response OmpR family regulator
MLTFGRSRYDATGRSAMKVLLVEDDRKIATIVKRGLDYEGFLVEVSFDGTEGLWKALSLSLFWCSLRISVPCFAGPPQVCQRLSRLATCA